MEDEFVDTTMHYIISSVNNPSLINVMVLTGIGIITYYLSKQGNNYLERKEREKQCVSIEDKIDGK